MNKQLIHDTNSNKATTERLSKYQEKVIELVRNKKNKESEENKK